MPNGIITIGYEGRTLDDFIATLRSLHVEVLVDVRLNAISRKPGFSKKALAAAALAAGIEYRHEPLLGNPRDNRDAYRAAEPGALARYRDRLSGESSQAVDRIVALAEEQRIAVLCFERDHNICHRDQLVDVARERCPTLTVTHA